MIITHIFYNISCRYFQRWNWVKIFSQNMFFSSNEAILHFFHPRSVMDIKLPFSYYLLIWSPTSRLGFNSPPPCTAVKPAMPVWPIRVCPDSVCPSSSESAVILCGVGWCTSRLWIPPAFLGGVIWSLVSTLSRVLICPPRLCVCCGWGQWTAATSGFTPPSTDSGL